MILTADDFGLSRAVNAGILKLVERNRLTAVSCMMISRAAKDDFRSLNSFSQNLDLGVHLVLTNEQPLSQNTSYFPKFPELCARSFVNQIDRSTTETEITAQLEMFCEIFGRWPDYVDGHQHVQQLPVIREILISVLKKIGFKGYVRSARRPPASKGNRLDRLSIYALGGKFASLLEQEKLKTNRYLFGHYAYRSKTQFTEVFTHELALHPGTNDIFMCHPGFIDDELKHHDRLVESREETLRVLMSPEFERICKKQDIRLNRN